MRAVHAEEAAAVSAELLNRDLRSRRAERDLLRSSFERRRVRVTREGLDYALAHEHDGENEREGQQHIQCAARQIGPEIAKCIRGAADERACESEHDRNTRRCAHEILHGEPEHLREVTHRCLARIRLPVRVRHEADGRIEREGYWHIAKPCWI